MTSERETTRERITRLLRADALTPQEVAAQFESRLTEREVLDHISHVRRSLDEDERVLVAPPECRDCGFDRFDDPAGGPSRCPECHAENLTDPVFTIRAAE